MKPLPKYIDSSLKPIPGIYAIKSKIDKRVYVGLSYNVRHRLLDHATFLKKNKHRNIQLQNFFNKHGIDFLEFVLIEYCSIERMVELEIYWIAHYDSYKNGFNRTKGGEMQNADNSEMAAKRFKTRMSNGHIVYIYAYDPQTGKLLHSCYTYKKMCEKFGVSSPSLASCLSGKGKTANGVHFSRIEKTVDEVLAAVKSEREKDYFKVEASKRTSGKNNPMFGRKRPDMQGDSHPFRKMIANGYDLHRKPRKLKISEDEIVILNNEGVSNKEISKKAGCGVANVCIILRKHGIFWGKGGTRNGKKILKAA